MYDITAISQEVTILEPYDLILMLHAHFKDIDSDLTTTFLKFYKDHFRSVEDSVNDLVKPYYDIFVNVLSHFHEFFLNLTS